MTSQAASDPFPADSLEANRSGRLTDAQRAGWTRVERSGRKSELVGAGLLAAVGVVLLTSQGPASEALLRIGVVVACFVGAVFLLWRSVTGADPLQQDLRAGRVESVEGALGRYHVEGRGGNPGLHYLEVDGRRLSCGLAAYNAASEPGIVRVYFLPRSKHVVNLERLPDRPLPAGALDDPKAVIGQVAGALRSHDGTQRAEAMATMEAMKNQVAALATPPPADQRDARPLAEAIVGAWHGPVMDITFSADGAASASMANGTSTAGRWSVGDDGKLHLDGMGQDLATEAWVAGDALTVLMGGHPMSFRRTGSA